MTQILDSLPSDQDAEAILCCYVNSTGKVQIVRISNISHWCLERTIFPGQRLLFEAVPEAQLEIHTGSMISAVLADTIPCERLQVQPLSKR